MEKQVQHRELSARMDNTHVETAMVKMDQMLSNDRWEVLEDRVPMDHYVELAAPADYMCVFSQLSRSNDMGTAYYANSVFGDETFADVFTLGKEQRKAFNACTSEMNDLDDGITNRIKCRNWNSPRNGKGR